MGKEYRVIDYDNEWYAEEMESQGVWNVLGIYDTKEEAENRVMEEKNGRVV